MSFTPLLATLHYRVIHPTTLDIVIEGLYHLHQSSWRVFGMQKGQSGSSSVGDFTIPIPPADSDEYRLYQWQYDLLKPGYRIEGYIMYDSTNPDLSSPPAFTGIIHQINIRYTTSEITGFDSIWLAQQQLTAPGETISCLAPDSSHVNGIHSPMVTNFLTMDGPILYDDFTSAFPGPQQGHFYRTTGTYIISPVSSWAYGSEFFIANGFSYTSGFGPNAFLTSQVTPSAEAVIFFNQLFGPSGLTDLQNSSTMTYQGWFFIQPALVGGGNTAFAAALAIGADNPNNFQNGYIFQVSGSDNGLGGHDIHAQIFQKIAGAYTSRADVAAFTAVPSTFNGHAAQYYIQLTGVISPGQTSGATGYNWRVLINGKDVGCVWNNTISPYTATTGYFGVRSLSNPASVGPNPVVGCERVIATGRTGPSFKQGLVLTTTNTASAVPESLIQTQGQTFLDMWNQAATKDGFIWRKRTGQFQDTIDYFDPVSTIDASAIAAFGAYDARALRGTNYWLTFEEDYNIVDVQVEASIDSLATAIQLVSNPVGQGGGIIDWADFFNMYILGLSPISNTSKPYLLKDTVPVLSLNDYRMFQQFAINLNGYKATPNSAKTITVLRDPIWADKIKEHYIVAIYAPKTLGRTQSPNPQIIGLIGPITARILGYTFVENSPTQEFFLDQFSFKNAFMGDRRSSANADNISRSFAQR